MDSNRLVARLGMAALLIGLAVPATAVAQEPPGPDEPVEVVDDMEDGLGQGTDPDGNPVGWTTFQDADSAIAIDTAPDADRPDAPADNDVLEVTGTVAAFAGTTHVFSNEALDAWVPQDWSGFAGFGMWVRGTGSGTGLFIDVLDNRNEGSTTDDAERWTVSFVDDFTGWQQLSWTWDQFARKGVGNGAPDDGFNLTAVHGWAFGATGTDGAEVTWGVDDVVVFGDRPLDLSFASPIVQVGEDAGTAEVELTLTRAAEDPVEATVSTSPSTDRTSSEDLIATPGRDYVPTSTDVTLAPGETSARFEVAILDDDDIEVDETVLVTMTDVVGAPDPGPAGRTSISILDDEERDPALVEDFEELHAPALLFATGDTAIDVRELEAGTPEALPDQDAFDDVLTVTGAGSAGHALPIGQDWSDSAGLTMWLYGTGNGEELTLRVHDDPAPDPGPDGWELAWADEFEDEAGTPADPENWTYETGGWGWGNQELQYYTDSTDNAAHDGAGNLVITTREVDDPEAAGLPCWYGDCTHTSARLISEGKQEFAYGRMEASVRTGDGTGIWPAFWSLGNDFRDVGWPQTGEIDMMEYVGRIPSEIFGTIHGPGYSGGASFSSGQIPVDPGPPEDFLEYAVVWQPGLITWEVTDGAGTRQYHEAVPADVDPNEWVFEHPFTLLLNVALGGNFGGPLGDDLDLPQETLVDWVRVWQAPDTAERFDATITDDVAGWRQVTVPWSAFTRSANQPDGAPDDGLDLTGVRGWELVVPDAEQRWVDDLRLAEVSPDTDTDGDGVPDLLEEAAGSDPDDETSVPQCAGRDHTILGSLDDDVLVGTNGNDVVVALDGDDTVRSLAGGDVVCGGRGDDRVQAGTGADTVLGGPGRDLLSGNDGTDAVDGGAGDDVLLGGNGRDTLLGGPGDDRMYAGRGPDVLLGEAGDDLADGNGGDDTCRAETTRACERTLSPSAADRVTDRLRTG